MWAELSEITDLGHSIRERRVELGWTQAELSARTGISQADISRLENGVIDAKWLTVVRISKALADESEPRRRSRANGGTVSSRPAPSTRWSPTGRTTTITRAPG